MDAGALFAAMKAGGLRAGLKQAAAEFKAEQQAEFSAKTISVITDKIKLAQGAGEIKGKQFLVYNSLISMLG